jgi:hypothetical protein
MGGMVRISVDEFSGGIDSCTVMHEDVHSRACVDDSTDAAGRERADVLYFDRAVSAEEVAAQLDVYPGCAVCVGASADGSIALAVRAGGGGGGGGSEGGHGRIDGRHMEILGLSGGVDGRGGMEADCALIASFVHALLIRVVRGGGAAPRTGSGSGTGTGVRVPLRGRRPDWPGR